MKTEITFSLGSISFDWGIVLLFITVWIYIICKTEDD